MRNLTIGSTLLPQCGRRLAILLAFCALTIVFALNATPVSAKPDGYKLGPGDKIKVTVFGQPNMSGQFSIAGDGGVSLPFIGNVQAGGNSIRELEAKIAQKLKPDYLKNPRVNVEVLNFRPFDILGEVTKPGSYPYRSGMTVINAVAMAGGFTYRAKENDFQIKRSVTGRWEKAKRDTEVRPGDVIKVLERWF